MSIGAKVLWSALLFVIGALGLALLKELYGYGFHRVVWSMTVVGTMGWIWIGAPKAKGSGNEVFSVVPHAAPHGGAIAPARNAHANQAVGNGWGLATKAIVICSLLIVGSAVVGGEIRTTASHFRSLQILQCDGVENTIGAVNVSITTGWLTKPTIAIQFGDSSRTLEIIEASATQYRATDHPCASRRA